MKTHLLRWGPIALFFVVATLSVALHLTRAAHEPCRPTPEIQPPPCQPLTCPDADRRESAVLHRYRPYEETEESRGGKFRERSIRCYRRKK
ncbi:MAG: hypothetical protein OYL97_08925 [Candidatus Poribacteria bacterium]|nr:hypothetical protein [Candidatus Poribacteria bacterium]